MAAPAHPDLARSSPAADRGTTLAALSVTGPASADPNALRAGQAQAGPLLLLGLLAAAAVLLWIRMLVNSPQLPLAWVAPASDGPVVAATRTSPLATWAGRPVAALVQADGAHLALAHLLPPQNGRWTVDDASRVRQQAQRDVTARLLQQPQLTWQFAQGDALTAPVAHRGLAGLGAGALVLSGLALMLMLAAAVLVSASPGLPSGLFALMALAEALHLLLIGAELMPGLGLPAPLLRLDLPLRWCADAVVAAALLHLAAVYPQRRPWARPFALAIWALGAMVLAGILSGWLPGAWWWAQGWALACGLLAAALLQRSHRLRHGPWARLVRYLVLAAVLTLALLSTTIALTSQDTPATQALAEAGWVVWHLFVASLMMLGPFLARSRLLSWEFALLAGVSTVAASTALLLDAGLDLNADASLALALAVSAALYLLVRPWVRQQMASPPAMSAERLFDSLYRVARALELNPDQAERQIGALLREVFDPLELTYSPRVAAAVRITQDGATLVVPCPQIGDDGAARPASGSIVLRHARQGQRLFSPDDRHLAERMIEQLSRAVAYDRAVERGRSEERMRLAQDLHDDIGARLLTMMYRAPNAEIEEYIRHTLQDLKTLTRGLAASNHRLSHAAAEWKSDLSQRLAATGSDLRWSFSTDRDLVLNVVQWSGLTRVIRELVNNIISHAQASQVEVSIQVDNGQLLLSVADDGVGRAPAGWSHGLGLGGVRKRVKLLGGQVQWLEQTPRGIRCEVRAPLAESRSA